MKWILVFALVGCATKPVSITYPVTPIDPAPSGYVTVGPGTEGKFTLDGNSCEVRSIAARTALKEGAPCLAVTNFKPPKGIVLSCEVLANDSISFSYCNVTKEAVQIQGNTPVGYVRKEEKQ